MSIIEQGFGCNNETFAAVSAPANAVNVIPAGEYRARTIIGPAEITMIDATVQEGAAAGNAAFMAGYYAIFIIKSSSPLAAADGTAPKNTNFALREIGTAMYGRFVTPAGAVPIEFPRGAMTCIKGEYLHVICTYVINNANLGQNTRISLGVYGNPLSDNVTPQKRYTAR